MKNKILLSATLLILIFISASCNSLDEKAGYEDISNEEADNEYYSDETEVLDIIPFKERKFIYKNGLNIEYKQESLSENNKNIEKYYPQLKGLLNKETEKKINNDIVNLVNERLMDVESSITSKLTDPSIKSISTNAYVNYSCNNVMFIEYSSYISYDSGAFSESYYFTKSQGYDLNTGNTIELKDLFKQGTDYNKILNDYIYMEIIKSNYDDPDSIYMNRPFQGIRKNQSFSFDENRLLIIMDEKNEEFNLQGYPLYMYVSLKDIGEHLAIFDRYFDEDNNIFENERIKKLMPNFSYYYINDGIREYEEHYSIYMETGEFFSIDDIETKKLLDDAVSHNLDVDGFRKRAEEYKLSHPLKYYGHMDHHVDVMMNEGGYFSLTAYSGKNELDVVEGYHKYINYDLNNKKMMTLKDLFVEGFNYKAAILGVLNTNQNYRLLKDTFLEDKEILISENDFNFNQDTVIVFLYQDDEHTSNIWIEYKDLGYENISILQ